MINICSKLTCHTLDLLDSDVSENIDAHQDSSIRASKTTFKPAFQYWEARANGMRLYLHKNITLISPLYLLLQWQKAKLGVNLILLWHLTTKIEILLEAINRCLRVQYIVFCCLYRPDVFEGESLTVHNTGHPRYLISYLTEQSHHNDSIKQVKFATTIRKAHTW